MLQTPVTFAPNDFAICTANVPTPPDAPLITLFAQAAPFPIANGSKGSERGSPTAADCSNVRLDGLGRRLFAAAPAYSANAPAHRPNTSSPGRDASRFADRLDLSGDIESWSRASACAAPTPSARRTARPSANASHRYWGPPPEPYEHLILLERPACRRLGAAGHRVSRTCLNDRLHRAPQARCSFRFRTTLSA